MDVPLSCLVVPWIEHLPTDKSQSVMARCDLHTFQFAAQSSIEQGFFSSLLYHLVNGLQ